MKPKFLIPKAATCPGGRKCCGTRFGSGTPAKMQERRYKRRLEHRETAKAVRDAQLENLEDDLEFYHEMLELHVDSGGDEADLYFQQVQHHMNRLRRGF